VEDLEATTQDGRVRLNWRLGTETQRQLFGVGVERADDASGPYVELLTPPLEPRMAMSFEDLEVVAEHDYWYRLVVVFRDRPRTIVGPIGIRTEWVQAGRTGLHQPFEPQDGGPVVIRYSIGLPAKLVRLVIYDARGCEVWRSGLAVRESGEHSVSWDRCDRSGARVSRGVYLVRLDAGDDMAARKLVLLHR